MFSGSKDAGIGFAKVSTFEKPDNSGDPEYTNVSVKRVGHPNKLLGLLALKSQ
jgi:hypothetical protein